MQRAGFEVSQNRQRQQVVHSPSDLMFVLRGHVHGQGCLLVRGASEHIIIKQSDQGIWGKSHGSSTSRKVLLITTCRRKEVGLPRDSNIP